MDSHPDFETLSAHLDGEAPEAAAHVESCGRCRARLDDLRSVAAAVAEVPPVPTGVRISALAAALAAAEPPARAGGSEPFGRSPVEGPTVDGAPAGSPPNQGRSGEGPAVVSLEEHRRRGGGAQSRTALWTALSSVAAVALALVAAVALLRPGGDDRILAGGPAPKAAQRDAATATSESAGSEAPSGPAGEAVPPVPEALGDLGEVGSPEELAAALSVRTARRFAAPAPRAAGDAPPGPPAADQVSPAPALTAPEPTPCVAEATGIAGGGALTYSASGTSGGRAVVVLGFSPAQEGPGTALVMDRSTCRLLYSVAVP